MSAYYRYEFCVPMKNSLDPDQLIWIYTVFTKGYNILKMICAAFVFLVRVRVNPS